MRLKPASAKILVAINNSKLPLDVAPDWIELIPSGKSIKGRDGRSWINDQPERIVEAFKKLGRSLVIDWEHGTEIKSAQAERAPAAGHIEDLKLMDGGAIWGKINWTPQGDEDVRTGAYRYVSPVFLFDKNTGRILELRSAGLVHEPNLGLKALNHSKPNMEFKSMDLTKVYAALGLVDGANEDQILAAIAKLKGDLDTAQNKINAPDLGKFVPRADYDKALDRAMNAENTLKTEQNKALEAEVDAVVKQALTDGKIAPASEAYYRAQCKKEGGLEEFKKFLGAAPKIVSDSPMTGSEPQNKNGQLTDADLAVCKAMGIAPDDFKKAKS